MRDLSSDPLRVCLEEMIQGSAEERWSALIAIALSDEGIRNRLLADLLGVVVPVNGRSGVTFEPSLWSSQRGAPDIALDVFEANGTLIHTVFLENKLDAKRTKHQPAGYLAELEQRFRDTGSRGDVVFLVPDGRTQTVLEAVQKELGDGLSPEHRVVGGFARVLVLSHENLARRMTEWATSDCTERGRAAAGTYCLMSGLLFRKFGDGPEVAARRARLEVEAEPAGSVIAGCKAALTRAGHRVKSTKSQGKIEYEGIRVRSVDVVSCPDAGLAWGRGLLWIQRKGTVSGVGASWPCYEALGFSRQSGIAGWSGVMVPVDLGGGRTVDEATTWVVGVVESTLAEGVES